MKKMRRTREVRQRDPSECGLASIAFILNYFGQAVSLNAIRSKYPLTLRGMSLANIRAIALDHDIRCIAVKIQPENIYELNLPSILHWGFDHFVVLESISKNGDARIMDPAVGRVKVPRSVLSQKLTGVAIEFEALQTDRKLDVVATGKNGLHNSSRRRIVIEMLKGVSISTGLTAFFMMIFAELGGIAISMLTAQTIEVIALKDIDKLRFFILTLIFCGSFVYLAGYIKERLFAAVVAELSFDVDARLVRGLLANPISYFEQRRGSHILTNYQAKNEFVDLISKNAANMAVSLLGVVASIVIIFLLYPLAGLVLIGILILIALLHIPLALRFRRIVLRRILGASQVNQIFLELIRSAASIKTSHITLKKSAEWRQEAQIFAEEQYAFRIVQEQRNLLSGVSGLIIVVVLLAMSGLAFSQGTLTFGSFLIILFLSTHSVTKIDGLSSNAFALCAVDVYLDRIADLLPSEGLNSQRRPFRTEYSEANTFPELVSLENVSFAYASNLPLVLENLDLEYRKPEMLAITGKSGAGKSSILKLLLGLHAPLKGRILVDGETVSAKEFRRIRTNSYSLFQQEMTIGASIEDNVVFNRYGVIDEQKVLEVLEIVELASDVFSMPMGVDTRIGDSGGSLSGGQVQRLMLARALYTDPSVIFLDEATSQIDAACEARILSRIREKGIGIVLIAHRAESIAIADRIFEVQGRAPSSADTTHR